jgi:hypothetical protein
VVPPVVLEGLEAVRASGAVNLGDLPVVQDVAAIMGYPETVLWIQEHPDEYAAGLLRGFVAAD